MKKKLTILTLLFLSSNLWASNACDTEKGVNLSISPGPYSSMNPTNQGRLGTCFAHSATNLLRSFMGVSDYANIIDAATISDAGVDGGDTKDVIEGFMDRKGSCYKNGKLYADSNGKAIPSPWMCKDNGGQFSNMFPSADQNILTELESILLTVPVHYTYDPNSKAGIERTNEIADLAIKMAKGEIKPCKIVDPMEKNYEQYLSLIKQIDVVEDKIDKLEDEKSSYGTEWLWTTFGYRSNSEINADISVQKNKKKDLETKKENAYKTYTQKDAKLEAGKLNFSYLDKLPVDEAAEIVYYWASEAYPKFKAVFEKYGIGKYAGTIDQFIKERVEKDPTKGFMYAGRMYAYKMVKIAVEKGCAVSNRICLDKVKVSKLDPKKDGDSVTHNKVQTLLTQTKPQGIGIHLDVSILDGSSRGSHAVNIVGCRTVTQNGQKRMQYLIHNSWGVSCNSYMTHLRGSDRCQNGRVWIDSQQVMNTASEIQWLSK